MDIQLCYVHNEPSTEIMGALCYYWEILKKREAYKKRFPAGDINTLEDFLRIATSPTNEMFLMVVKEDNDLIGEFMLTDWTGLAAQIHVSGNPKYYRRNREITTQVFNKLFDMPRLDGNPYVHTLMGLTPVTNRLSVKFNADAGFKQLGVIPKAMYVHPGQYVDAVATILTKEILEEHTNGKRR